MDISGQKGRLRETRFFEFSSSLCLTARVTKATFSHFWASTVFHTESPRQKGSCESRVNCASTPRLTSLRKTCPSDKPPPLFHLHCCRGEGQAGLGQRGRGLVQRGGPARTGTWPPGQPCQGPQASLFQSPQRMRNDHWPNIISGWTPIGWLKYMAHLSPATGLEEWHRPYCPEIQTEPKLYKSLRSHTGGDSAVETQSQILM